jgi:hypothetical protein
VILECNVWPYEGEVVVSSNPYVRFAQIYLLRRKIHRIRGWHEHYLNFIGTYRIWKFGGPL